MRYDLKPHIFVDFGVGLSRATGGKSSYEPEASVRRFIVTYDAQTVIQGSIGLGYKF